MLGIIPTAPAAETVELSPRIYDLTWAEGKFATTKGVISVRWKINGQTLDIHYSAPAGVDLQFKSNPTLERFEKILLNGKEVK